ncbi:hypothetical protein PF008_g6088 [Phytophthora fragariae]|uniref:Uncharacterized protein n=1 Tax=Phytophthora fragariae TaxID=53985 RepID=A0A6G0S6N9_9STRA|nr:hypothetical protein PF008_g6088 [Phytophthora fragariae]
MPASEKPANGAETAEETSDSMKFAAAKAEKKLASSKPAPKKPTQKKPTANQPRKKKGVSKEARTTLKLPPKRKGVLAPGLYEATSSSESDTDTPNPGLLITCDEPTPVSDLKAHRAPKAGRLLLRTQTIWIP